MVWRLPARWCGARAGDVGVKFLSAPRIAAPKRAQVISAVVPPKAISLRRLPTLPGRS